MVDKPIKPPGSITQPADNKNERISEVSNVNHAISEMQKKVNQQLSEAEVDVGEFEGIAEVQNSMIKVLNSLNSTVGSIGYGFAKIAAETGKASAGAVTQYGKAISADINLNKQNVVAMALARSSPIFGYFAAKFVETDVFQNAKEKMKSNISEALGGVTSKFKEGMGSLISRARLKGKKDRPIKGVEPPKEKVPKMQHGGYVEKAGLASLHPAEVVVPIDKILNRIDESIGVTKDLALISRRAQLNTLAKMSTYVKSVEQFEKVGVFKGFMSAMRQVQEQYTEPSDIRQLRALLAIQDALGAQVGTLQQVWQKMLVNHPVFRNITFAMRGLGSVFSMPFKFAYGVFKSRGGYQSHLSRTRNPMKAMVENIGLVYSEGMWRLDNIALFTKATAEATRDLSGALIGKKYPPLEGVPTGVWSFANIAKRIGGFIFGRRRKSQKKALKELYGGSEGAGKVSRLFSKGKDAKDSPGYKPMIVSEIHLARFTKYAIKYMIENKKHQKKLLGYTANMDDTIEGEYKITKRMDKRERRRSIFGFFGGALGGIKDLIGSGLGMILPMIAGTLLPWAKGFFFSLTTKIFPKGVTTAITTLLGSSVVWTAIAVAAAAAFGLAVGKLLDKLLGISSGFKASLERMDKKANEAAKIQAGITTEKFKRSRGGGVRGYESLQELKLRAQLGGKARARSVGMDGRTNLLAIDSAQQKYMHENIHEYLKYGPGQIQALRSEWIKGEAFGAKRIGYDPEKYGTEREASFLKYLQTKGKPLSEIEREAGYKKYAAGIPLIDRVGGIIVDQKAIAKENIERAAAHTKAIKEGLKEQGKAIKEGTMEVGKGIVTSVSHATNAVTTSVQNVQHVVHNSTQRVKDIFSEYDYAVIRGDYMSEDF